MPEVLAVPTFDFEVPFGSPNSPARSHSHPRSSFRFPEHLSRARLVSPGARSEAHGTSVCSPHSLCFQRRAPAPVWLPTEAGGLTHFTVGDPLGRTGRQGTPAFCSGHPPAPTMPLTPRRRPVVQPPRGPSSRFGLGWLSLAPPHGDQASPTRDAFHSQEPRRAIRCLRPHGPVQRPTRFAQGASSLPWTRWSSFLAWCPRMGSQEVPPPSAACELLQHDTTRGHLREFKAPNVLMALGDAAPKNRAGRRSTAWGALLTPSPKPSIPDTLCRPTASALGERPAAHRPTGPETPLSDIRSAKNGHPREKARCLPPPLSRTEPWLAPGRALRRTCPRCTRRLFDPLSTAALTGVPR